MSRGSGQIDPALNWKDKAQKTKTPDVVATAEKPEKRLSCVTAAIKVLAESTEPLTAQQIVAAMSTKGYWSSPGGKTPDFGED